MADVGVVEAGEYLPFLDGHAFFDGDLDEAARHLGGDRRLPTRDDVAGRVEHRWRGSAGPRLGDGGRLDDDRVAGEKPPGGDGHEENRQAEQQEPPRPGTRAGSLGSVDAKLVEAAALGHVGWRLDGLAWNVRPPDVAARGAPARRSGSTGR